MASNPLRPTSALPRAFIPGTMAVVLMLVASTAMAGPAAPGESATTVPDGGTPASVDPFLDAEPATASVDPFPDAEPDREGAPAPVTEAPTVPIFAEPESPPVPEPSPTPAEDPISSAPIMGREDGALVAARMVGTETADAGVYFSSYAGSLGVVSLFYGSSAPGITLGMAIGALVNGSLGAVLLTIGSRRMKATDQWLDAKPGRRARFVAKARQRRLSLLPERFSGASLPIVQRGTRLKETGVGTLIAGGILNGVAIGVAPVAPVAGISLNIAGWAAVVTGAVLASRGKKMMFRPDEYGGERLPLALVPTVLTGPAGHRVPGLSLAAHW